MVARGCVMSRNAWRWCLEDLMRLANVQANRSSLVPGANELWVSVQCTIAGKYSGICANKAYLKRDELYNTCQNLNAHLQMLWRIHFIRVMEILHPNPEFLESQKMI